MHLLMKYTDNLKLIEENHKNADVRAGESSVIPAYKKTEITP
jgi:hypothetical protein